MLARHKLATVTAAAAVLALGAAAPAHAAESADATQKVLSQPIQDCGDNGAFWKRGTGMLAYGVLDFVFCEREGSITRINASYTKSGGADSNLRFGWSQTNRNGVAKLTDWGPAFTQPANTTYSHAWTGYYIRLSESFPCMQGLLQDQNTGRVFYTERVCA